MQLLDHAHMRMLKRLEYNTFAYFCYFAEKSRN